MVNKSRQFIVLAGFITKGTDWNKKLLGFPGGSDGEEATCNAGDRGSISGLGRSPGEENGNPLQYSRLENSKDRGFSLDKTAFGEKTKRLGGEIKKKKIYIYIYILSPQFHNSSVFCLPPLPHISPATGPSFQHWQ